VVVAIDGPSGVGKTTVSRAVASALGLPYLDTGAYYRMATLVTLRDGADPDSDDAVLGAIADTDIDFIDGRLLLDGQDVTIALRGEDVTAAVSVVAAHRRVREVIVDLQRSWVARNGGSAVVEGRDIGTVVFPDAAWKVFLTADPETRARRRAGDEEASGRDLDDIAAGLRARDAADSNREASPLRPADDAVTIDTTDLTVVEVVGQILNLVGEVGE
jgi:cytidylate kinase